MPKKPEIRCPLRALRLITGKTQVEFATVLGCSPSTIKKVEAGDNSKLHPRLILAASYAFCVSPDSLIPPSTQPTQLNGEPYTKEFHDEWWKTAPEAIKPIIQGQKAAMLRELEMVLAAAMRAPGMRFGAVVVSFIDWVREAITDFQLFPFYEAECKERMKRAKKIPNKTQVDWELVKLFASDKSKFIQAAYEADGGTPFLMAGLLEAKKAAAENDLGLDWLKKPKAERLRIGINLSTKSARKAFYAGTATNSGPKRTR